VWFLALPGVPGVAGRTSGEWLQQFGFYRRIPENCSGPILISRVRRFVLHAVDDRRHKAESGGGRGFQPHRVYCPVSAVLRLPPFLASIIDWFTREPI
jgi:hypothetical protein